MQTRAVLTYDDEVGGWDSLQSNDESYCRDFPHAAARLPQLRRSHEPALRVFDSRVEEHKESKVIPEDEPWPTITYQVRFGNDQ